MRELQSRLGDAVDELRNSERWHEFLRFASSFHQYSVNNLLLIRLQCPHATAVAGFRQWQSRGRQVRRGEMAIRIFGFAKRKRVVEGGPPGAGGQEEQVYFPPVSVFDISQTDSIDGTEPPTISEPLAGTAGHENVDKVVALLEARNWTVETRPLEGGRNGYTMMGGQRRVVMAEGLEPTMHLKTLLHETAHVLLHAEDEVGKLLERDVQEVEAESVAYVVAGYLGIDTAAYSVGYVAGWAGADTSVIRDHATRVIRAANTVITELENETEPQIEPIIAK